MYFIYLHILLSLNAKCNEETFRQFKHACMHVYTAYTRCIYIYIYIPLILVRVLRSPTGLVGVTVTAVAAVNATDGYDGRFSFHHRRLAEMQTGFLQFVECE